MKISTLFYWLMLACLGGINSLSAQTWTKKTDFGGTARQLAVGFSIGTKGYIGTGSNSSGYVKDFWEYDPATNAWTQKADFGGTERESAVGFSIGSKGYIGTGYDGNYREDFWEYNPATNAWTQKTDFGGEARSAAVGFSIGSKGYIGTGDDGGSFKKIFWEYSCATEICNGLDDDCNTIIDDVVVSCTAGTRTWTGAVSTDWNTPCNWTPACVPTADDHVVIADVANDPTIGAGTAALARSVVVNTDAVLTIAAEGSLTVNGSTTYVFSTNSFRNAGTVHNNGTITIGSVGFNLRTYGIYNQATFNNNTGGQINIDRWTDSGLYNESGVFTNTGAITIGAIASTGNYGLWNNNATFNNNTGGQINIDRSASSGLRNWGDFANAATITIGANVSAGSYGLWNNNNFNNNTGGQINIDRWGSRGLYNDSGTFTSKGAITIGALAQAGDAGLVNEAKFNNDPGGQIKIDNCDNAGLDNEDVDGNTVFNNKGIIIIGATASVGFTGITNSGTFNNQTSGATIKIDNTAYAGLSNIPGCPGLVGNNTGVKSSMGYSGHEDGTTSKNNTGKQTQTDQSMFVGGGNQCLGTFNNEGSIIIGETASVGQYGISNNGIFNNTGGQINIDRSTGSNSAGLYNQSGTFTNEAAITIGANESVGLYGLRNAATFKNNTGGQINIDRSTGSSSAGLLNSGSGAKFTNAATITIGANASVGIVGLVNAATFDNNPGGQINIDRSTDRGLNNTFLANLSSFGTFNNAASIIIGANASVGAYGLRNFTTFNNNAGGQIHIDNSTSAGIINIFNSSVTAPTFTNAANIIIGANASVGSFGIENQTTFNNNVCATISTTAPISNAAGKTITNAGLFTVNTTGAHTNDGAFTNNGIIEYPQGNPIPNVTNNEIVVAPISGSGQISPALSLGMPVDFTIGSTWYLNPNLPDPAGTFNQATNTFTNIALEDGVPTTVYFLIYDATGGCDRMVSIKITWLACVPTTAFTACPGNLPVNVDPGTCTAAVTYTVIANGDPAPGYTYSFSGATTDSDNGTGSGSTFNKGVTQVTVTATNDCGSETCQFNVTVTDNIKPSVQCKNFQVTLNSQNQASITPINVHQSSSDNCGSVSLVSVEPNTFSCEDVGNVTVVLTVTDNNGNDNTCEATVQVKETQLPAVYCKDATVNLGTGGTVSISPEEVYLNGSDNCGTVNLESVTPNTFGCNEIGANPVTLTVNDGNGNSNTCPATVTVVHNFNLGQTFTAPAANDGEICNGGDAAIDLLLSPSNNNYFEGTDYHFEIVNMRHRFDSNDPWSVGYGPVTGSENYTNGQTISFLNETLSHDHPGPVELRYRVKLVDDNCGTEVFKNFRIVVLPKPAITCPDPLTVGTSDDGTGDCATDVTFTHPDELNGACAPIYLTMVIDQSSTIYSVAQGGTWTEAFEVGNHRVDYTIIDGNNNTNMCTYFITVEDDEDPVAGCEDITVELDANGEAAITWEDVEDGTTSDNCGVNPNGFSLDVSAFDCSNAGTNTVTLTVTDVNDRMASCTSTVTVAEYMPPTAECNNVTVQLDDEGNGSLVASELDGGSSDNCGIVNSTLSQSTFGCGDVGTVTVTLTVYDAGGLSDECTAEVTVTDETIPDARCKDITITLGSNGSYTLGAAEVDDVSTDACGIGGMSVSPDFFTCGDAPGPNEVVLTVTDVNGNAGTCTANVTINDFVWFGTPAFTVTNETCTGYSDGTITIHAGTTSSNSLLYSIDGGVWYTTQNVFTGLTPGTYNIKVFVQGTQDCYLTATATVNPGSTLQTWYKDFDGDGYTDGSTQTGCVAPAGFVASAQPGDCNDNNASLNPATVWYKDGDNDGYSNGQTLTQCLQPPGYKLAVNLTATSGDCNDGNVAIHPNATEVCNGLDDNCNAQTDEGVSGSTYVGNVTFANQTQVNAWLPCFSVIQGNLVISGLTINNLSPLSNITQVTGSVTIQASGLSSPAGLSGLTTIGGSLVISSNTSMTSLNGLQGVMSVGGNLNVMLNSNLSLCCGIRHLLDTDPGNGWVTGSKTVMLNKPGGNCTGIPVILNTCAPQALLAPPSAGNAPTTLPDARKMTLFPNPATGEVTVTLGGGYESGILRVYDAMGRLTSVRELAPDSQQERIEVGDWMPGVYLVQAQLDGEVLVQRLVVE